MNFPSDIDTAISELLSLDSKQVGRTVPLAEWNSLHPAVSSIFPAWYRELMAQYPLAGREFDIDEEGPYEGGFYQGEIYFWEPSFIEYIKNEEELSFFWGLDLTAQDTGFPIFHLPDGEFMISKSLNIEGASVINFNGISLDENSGLSCSFKEFLSRLFPSDHEGGVAC